MAKRNSDIQENLLKVKHTLCWSQPELTYTQSVGGGLPKQHIISESIMFD